jgi:ATP-binding cassette, subfamily B (MDR/TAP), member 1
MRVLTPSLWGVCDFSGKLLDVFSCSTMPNLPSKALIHDLFYFVCRFADTSALTQFGLAFCFAVGNGVITPLFSVIFGNLVDSFSKPGPSIQSDVNEKVLSLVYLSIAALLVGAGEVALTAFSTKRQLTSGRMMLMDMIISRPLSWHQVNKSSELVNETMNRDLPAIELGLNGMIKGIRHSVCCIAGLAVALSKGPLLTIIVMSIVLPTLSLSNIALKRLSKRYQAELIRLTRQTNSIVRETFSQIKTIASFNLEAIFDKKYLLFLPALERESVITLFLSGAETAIMAGIFSFSYAVAIFYGAKKVAEGDYSGGQVLSVLFASIMAGFSASEALPCIHSVYSANDSMKNICSTIFVCDAQPETEGSEDIDFNMDIQFRDVCFAYPTRPEKMILSNLNLSLRSNSSSAIVGPSGSGKVRQLPLIM